MDDKARRDIIVEIETSPGTVDLDAEDPGKFPFDAFEFEDGSLSITRAFKVSGVDVGAKLVELEARLEAIQGKFHVALALGGRGTLRTPVVVFS